MTTTLIITFFILGYLAIIFEFYVKVNKTAAGIAIAGLVWLCYFVGGVESVDASYATLSHHLSSASQILFFLLGAMTLVELIDSHKGFNGLIKIIHTHSKRLTLVIITVLSFFLSALLDNLTTTILMLSIVRKLVPNKSDRLAINCMVVIAANAGGAWTPIGDVTTTMLWIQKRVSTLSVMREIFLPSVICTLVPLGCFLAPMQGEFPKTALDFQHEKKEPYATLIFTLGLLALILVPIIKWLTGLPPFMGMLIGLAFLWIVTDIIHYKHEHRQHLRIPFILTKIDVSTIIFFLGILLAVDALSSVGTLKEVAYWLDRHLPSMNWVAAIIGIASAIIDNVPIVAASMQMYDISAFPMDSSFWLLVAYTAGTGGSILSIGSAAGVALMGIEKVDFISYLKKATIPALLGYLAGLFFYIAIS